jgi:hypothetical protein
MIPREDAEATGRAMCGGSVLRLIPRAAGEIIPGPPAGRPGPAGATHRTNGKEFP